MKLFIDTDDITNNEELYKAIEKNNSISRNLQIEMKELKNISLTEETEKITIIEEDDEYDEKEEKDIEFEYYYELIKDIKPGISTDEMKEIISDNLPSKNNSNYFNIMGRIKAEIYKEYMEYVKMLPDAEDDEELKKDIVSIIKLEQQKLEMIKEVENEKEVSEDHNIENKIVFLKTNLGNVCAIDELKSINNEYYESFIELFDSIKNGTFKGVKRLNTSNEKVNSISEVRGFKTRVMFDKIGKNTIVILKAVIKKSNFDRGYKEALEKRVSFYRIKKDHIVENIENEEYMLENLEYEKELYSMLSQNKRKVMTND